MAHVDGPGSGSVASLLRWRAAESPDFGFLYVEDEGPWTFAHVAAHAVEIADALARAGVTHGSRVLVILGNEERFVSAINAVWMLGGVVVPVHPATPAGVLTEIVTSQRADAIAAPVDFLADGLAIPIVPVETASWSEPADRERSARFVSPADVDDADTALVLLTSGSTGAPKGVRLTHGSAWANLRSTVSAFRSNTAPSLVLDASKPPNLLANPVSHTAGIVRILFALYVGRGLVFVRKFQAPLVKRLLDRHRIDNLTINPAMIRMLVDGLEPGEGLGKVRYVSSGTAPLAPATREEFESRFGVPVLQAYGQTEAFGGVAIESVRDVLSGNRRPGSVGKPLPGVQIRLDDNGSDVGVGDEGEIWVKTRSAMSGYEGGNGESPVDAAGWLHSGDIGRFDEDGYLYITGRIKNIIICGGFNIVPEEVESALIRNPEVHDAVVVPIPDQRLGELPVALVESTQSAETVGEEVSSLVASYKRPRFIFVVDALPRVANGKLDRPAAARLAAELSVASPAGASPTGGPVK